jgi:uncharacterized protein YnzC (UPF0291/DUF896 family)
MIPKELVDRINELAKKSREDSLTDSEKAEQQALRQEYLAGIRARAKGAVESITVEESDGTRHKLPHEG